MKKLLAFLCASLLSASGFALPLGNPWEASLMFTGIFWDSYSSNPCDPCFNWYDGWSLRAGFYGDYVFNHHMEVDRNEANPSIRETELFTNAGYVAFNMWNKGDIFAAFGATQIDIETPGSSFGGANRLVRVETETGFSWSIGARGTIWELGNFGFGAEAQYFATCPDINYVKDGASAPVYISNNTLKYREWQAGIGAAYFIHISSCSTAVIPYLGVKWGHTWIKMHDLQAAGFTFYNLANERNFGYAFGVSILACNRACVTAEVRFIDEKALYVNGQFRF